MARDFRELIREDIRNNPDFAAGLYQDCIDLLQSDDSEDRDTGESMLRNYFGADALRAARLQADTPVEPASNAAN
ncbi:MAG: hypothetical protein OXI54_11620 [Chloroflexota bacterium]|nr:hypothetical protein [Chloroflexota bacterium]MDE2684779.1 hypothetical protein [Chloroflexota bacterium]